VTAPLDVIERLVKFKWGDLARRHFSIERRSIELMEAESKLEGREVAYIVKARERFGQ
jgi:hypothetical protein